MQKKKPHREGTTRMERRKSEKKSLPTWISVAAELAKTAYYAIGAYDFFL